MSDDLFSRLFELFDQPGPVNWKLAAEVARHLAGDPQPVEPWIAEEFRDLARLAEFHLEKVAPFRVEPASDVIPLDQRGWAERNLESYGSLVEPFATSIGVEGPTAQLFAQMAPIIIGLQAGSLVGSLSTWAMAGFDSGLPPDHPGPMTVIVPNVDDMSPEEFDRREVRLWVVANEASFRSICAVPWVPDHLAVLVADYAAATHIDPTRLSSLMAGGADPALLESAIEEAGGITSLIGGDEAEAPRAELEAFLGALTGAARLLARRAISGVAPRFDLISEERDRARSETIGGFPTISVGPVPPEATRLGDVFNQEVERRYGDDALATLWSDPTRMPNAAELRDPTSWAARVLLDGWT
ncbi:MAG: zinc-dependent metalloprotease [Actinobacteria bacterium]|nr:zinc-dependent metalloprotease [Actinomycetota bacterium]